MMKRFMVFAGDSFYPCGGTNDFVADFDTIYEVKDFLYDNVCRKDANYEYDWANYYDSVEGTFTKYIR